MVSKAVPRFDISKYYEPFLKDDDIRGLAAQLSKSDLAWWSMLFLACKIAALFCLYAMFERNKEKQMLLDKQKYEQDLAGQLELDNEVNK